MAAKPSTPAIDVAIPLDQRVYLLELRDHHCLWPCGDPKDRDFFFCGGDRLAGHAYCEKHCLRAYARFVPEQADAS